MTTAQKLLTGRTAMITGASAGIGAAAAELFAGHGAAVVLMARRADRLAELVTRIEDAGGRAVAVPGDVAVPEDVERAVKVAVSTFGGLDAAFNNAGFVSAAVPMHEIDDEDYQRTIDVNLRGVWTCMRQQIPVMLASGGGSIVNTSSVAGLRATGASAAYVAAKHAVIGLTKAAAADYGQRGIRVNALVVGSTRTEMMEQVLSVSPELEQRFVANSAQRRMAAPVEVAQAAAWLCSDLSTFVTGTAMAVDGGSTSVA
ncbi:SDR family NAD(P)-dependent oxidoreductase [Streptantibioticus silvisoli]|uniref:Glucose 1-dehydrogenase n=1 Tax=Streptantibioticus silvisoli TaxID=2705255 RepID=A0ABT6W8L8_9ACTN|nr:glucose 1-dehydrogenase [Streptantibioticus silvisoli]MDI5966999.1 glucose 1-dehydrogenase [Streptantibioticus silvisoli]